MRNLPGRAGGGLGLGLFVVRKFAEIQGGRAWVEDAPGGGAPFRVLLPDEPQARN
ncbi:MAG: ATP-binding protein [Acidimicrobiales bacterium]